MKSVAAVVFLMACQAACAAGVPVRTLSLSHRLSPASSSARFKGKSSLPALRVKRSKMLRPKSSTNPAVLSLITKSLNASSVDELPAKRIFKTKALPRRGLPATITFSPGKFVKHGGKKKKSIVAFKHIPASITKITKPINLKFLPVSVKIDYIDSIYYGVYMLKFRYTLHPFPKVKTPLRFFARFQGDAENWVSQYPHQYTSGGAVDRSAGILLYVAGVNTPLKCKATSISIRVMDADNKEVATFTKKHGFTFVKRYMDITRDNIKSYIAGTSTKSNALKLSKIWLDQYKYDAQPALLFFKTSDGNYVKALVRVVGSGKKRFLALQEAQCFARNQNVFSHWQSCSPSADSNIEYAQLFGEGGYIYYGRSFDFDKYGLNTPSDKRDIIIVNVYSNGKSITQIRCRNNTIIAY